MIIDRGFDELKPFLTIMNPKGDIVFLNILFKKYKIKKNHKYHIFHSITGDCNNYQRKKIGFGVNEKVGCVMTKTKSELSETCHTIRKHAIGKK